MENAVEAMKMAFGFMMFVLALTLSISCFSQAMIAIDNITTIRDRETQYTYVTPSSKKIVGVETIVPTMYKAYNENFKIYFYESYTDETNNIPLYLYEYIDTKGKIIEVNYVDLEEESFPNLEEALNHLTELLNPRTRSNKYKNQFIHIQGLYDYFKNHKFQEVLGEYYMEHSAAGMELDTSETNKTKKRVITYILQP